jgi:hypothetical protein
MASKISYPPPYVLALQGGSAAARKKHEPIAIVMSGAFSPALQYGCARMAPSRRSPSPSIAYVARAPGRSPVSRASTTSSFAAVASSVSACSAPSCPVRQAIRIGPGASACTHKSALV